MWGVMWYKDNDEYTILFNVEFALTIFSIAGVTDLYWVTEECLKWIKTVGQRYKMFWFFTRNWETRWREFVV